VKRLLSAAVTEHPIVEKVIPIDKEVHLFEKDPILQKYLATEVVIQGRMVDGSFHYKEIHPVSAMATVF
jgi:hypothetical protein